MYLYTIKYCTHLKVLLALTFGAYLEEEPFCWRWGFYFVVFILRGEGWEQLWLAGSWSLTRDWTHALAVKASSPNHRTTREFPVVFLTYPTWVKNLPPMQETWVRSLGQEDPPEECMATHSSILAWRISCTEESGRLHSMGLQSQTWLSD